MKKECKMKANTEQNERAIIINANQVEYKKNFAYETGFLNIPTTTFDDSEGHGVAVNQESHLFDNQADFNVEHQQLSRIAPKHIHSYDIKTPNEKEPSIIKSIVSKLASGIVNSKSSSTPASNCTTNKSLSLSHKKQNLPTA
jgi:hypothetical protein